LQLLIGDLTFIAHLFIALQPLSVALLRDDALIGEALLGDELLGDALLCDALRLRGLFVREKLEIGGNDVLLYMDHCAKLSLIRMKGYCIVPSFSLISFALVWERTHIILSGRYLLTPDSLSSCR
jgi:hypothetical protein